MKNEQNSKIVYWKTLLIGVLSIILGAISWVFNMWWNDYGWLFLIFGLMDIIVVIYENYKYRKTGEVPQDERYDLNVLKASRNGFLFLVISQFWLLIFMEEINPLIFFGLFIVTLGLGCFIYAISYYAYEQGVEEKKISLISIGVGILGVAVVIFGIWSISQFNFNQTTEIHKVVMAEKLENGKPVTEKTEFGKDAEIIYACANVTSTPFESTLYVRWYDLYGGYKVLENFATIDCTGCCWQCFNITKPADGWRPGEYDLEFYFDDYDPNKDHNFTKFKIV